MLAYYLTPTLHQGNKPIRWGIFSYEPDKPYFGAGTDSLVKSYKYFKCASKMLTKLEEQRTKMLEG